MKVLHCADIHLTAGPDDDASKALLRIAEAAINHNVDVVHVNGDVFDSKSTPTQRLVFKSFIDILKAKHIETVIIRGNHDEAGDLMVYDDRLNNIYVVEKPESLALMGGNYRVFCVPHFHAGALALNHDTQREIGQAGSAAFDELLDALWNEANLWRGQAMALVFHGVVSGAALDNGYVPRTNGIHLSPDRLAVFPGIVVGGHYHKHQDITGEGRVFYSGSPVAHTFGEETTKGYLIVEHNGPHFEVAFKELHTRNLYTLRGIYDGGQIVWEDQALMVAARLDEGANIKVVMTVKKNELSAYKTHLMGETFPHANLVKFETSVIVDEAVRCAAIEKAETVVDSVKIWLESVGQPQEKIADLVRLFQNVTSDCEATAPIVLNNEPVAQGNLF